MFPRESARRAELAVFLDWFNEVWKLDPNTIEDELERDDPDKERVALHLEDNLRLEEGHPRLSAWIDRVNERQRA